VSVLRLIASELSHRRGRALALLAGIAVATAAFTVLTGASTSAQLEVRGDVARHFRASYDILVRPHRSVAALERAVGLVQQNQMAGAFGGITDDQLRAVRHAPGVEVAAPLAVYGYVMPTAQIPISVAGALRAGPRSAFRVRMRWTGDRGTVRVQDPDSYIYVTRNRVIGAPPHVAGQPIRTGGIEQFGSEANAAPICPTPTIARSAFATASRSWLWCWSTRTGLGEGDRGVHRYAGGPGARIPFPFPLLVAGIDPHAEAALSGAREAVVSGRYFRDDEGFRTLNGGYRVQVAPLLAAATTTTDLRVHVTVERLPARAADALARARADRGAAKRALASAAGTPLLHRTITAAEAYKSVVGTMTAGQQWVDTKWTSGPARYTTVGAHHVRAVPVRTDRFAWGAGFSSDGIGTGFVTAPVTAQGTAFRPFTEHITSGDHPPFLAAYQAVGTFDPRRLADALDPFLAPLNPFHPPTALAPDGSIGSYAMAPPALLTTLKAGDTFLRPKVYGNDTEPQAAAPISLIRVRVKGVTGPGKASRERIRLAADAIARRTGLQVDVTAGSSPTPVAVDVPASGLGRPATTAREAWMKKGVATAILTAVDRKSLVLFVLVLLVCALFCVNATSAAVRSRASELGVLACVGWPRRALFRYLLGEVALIGLAAGLAGALVAVPAGAALGLPVSGLRAAIAVPGALALALGAGAVPAARAARSDPLAAVRPAVRTTRSAGAVRTVPGLAARNLLRVPGRTALGVVSLGVGVFALTALLAVTAAFRGAVVGTVLGDAVAVQVRTADYVAVGATLLLGALAVADVLYLNLRDRSAEIATLRATGWRERQLTRLVALEGAGLGVLGGLGGAVLGLAAATAFTGELTAAMPLVAALAALGAVVLAVAASIPPAAGLRRLPTATLLAEE
jgi:putative ABC transport system permease protein